MTEEKSTVKRYAGIENRSGMGFSDGIAPSSTGGFVSYEDYQKIVVERDTLAKRSEEIAEKYSQLVDKYAKALDEVIELKKQLAPRQSVQEAAKVLLNTPRTTTGPLAHAGRVAEEFLSDVECGGEITTEIIEAFLRTLAQKENSDE